MDKKEFKKFVSYLLKNYAVFSLQEENGILAPAEIFSFEDASLNKRLPFYPWKRFFVLEKENLFEYENENLKIIKIRKSESRPVALLGMNHIDLNAIALYDKVFVDDPLYLARQENNLIIGYSFETEMPDGEIRKITEENLKNIRFDIYLAENNEKFNVYTGSEKGKNILDKIKYEGFAHIKFEGHKYAPEWAAKMNLRRHKLKNRHNPKIWEELGKRCIECGKCTIACPTCFCFRIDDEPSIEFAKGCRQRCWDSCYYSEFSEVAGPSTGSGQAEKPKFLKNTAQRIHFWYNHKFARIPDEFNMMGCVGCHRCHAVCPVEIDIRKVMESVENSN